MYFDTGLIEIKEKKSINSRSTTRFGWVYIGFNFVTFSIFLSEGGGGGILLVCFMLWKLELLVSASAAVWAVSRHCATYSIHFVTRLVLQRPSSHLSGVQEIMGLSC